MAPDPAGARMAPVGRPSAELMRLARHAQPDDLVLDLQFSLLEAAERIVVGLRSCGLLVDRLLERSMLGLQRFDVVHGTHRRPPAFCRNEKPDSVEAASHGKSTVLSTACINDVGCWYG